MSVYAVTNPATGEQVKTFPTITDEELDSAIALAYDTYQNWLRSSTVEERAKLVRRVGSCTPSGGSSWPTSPPVRWASPWSRRSVRSTSASTSTAFYADNGPDLMKDEPIELLAGEGSAIIRRSPYGVILGIMPWNFPTYQVARFAGPNLVIGNAVLLKHAPQCPETAAALQQIYLDAGFPEGAYVNIYATNEQIAQVIADPRVQGVSVTGSERAGAAVAEIAGRNLKKVVLELGGSDPFILLSTDDMDATVDAAVAARLDNAGQSCNAAKRFVVIDELYQPFLEKFTAAMTSSKTGDPTADDCQLGPLSSSTAADRLQDQLDRATKGGAKVVAGGERDGNYFSPMVLTDVTPDNDAYREELFGPVAVVYRVGSEDEAVKLANDTPFGLGSYLFTTDPEQADRVANQIDAGMVYVNIVGADGAELPFGGVKRSGWGRELGKYGMDEFVNKKLIRVG